MNHTDNIAQELNQFIGSQTFTRWSVLSQSVLTEGTQYLAETGNCYWLFDAIQSHVDELGEDMVQSVLTVQDDSTAVLELDDMNDNIIASQVISYTDFPLSIIKIWSVRNETGAFTHMLPREY